MYAMHACMLLADMYAGGCFGQLNLNGGCKDCDKSSSWVVISYR